MECYIKGSAIDLNILNAMYKICVILKVYSYCKYGSHCKVTLCCIFKHPYLSGPSLTHWYTLWQGVTEGSLSYTSQSHYGWNVSSTVSSVYSLPLELKLCLLVWDVWPPVTAVTNDYLLNCWLWLKRFPIWQTGYQTRKNWKWQKCSFFFKALCYAG
jgi:hypothetical protein